MIGHNGGPSMEPGYGFRKLAWGKARKALLPTLPLQIVRLRVARAAALGLDYRTYATVRAASGRDITAFLFSSNALRMMRPGEAPPEDRREKVAASAADRLLAARGPLVVSAAATLEAAGIPFDGIGRAPSLRDTDREMRERIAHIVAARHRSEVLLIGETALERSWCASARLGGWLPAERWASGGPS